MFEVHCFFKNPIPMVKDVVTGKLNVMPLLPDFNNRIFTFRPILGLV